MSMCYWICQGIGIRTNELYSFLNKDKCVSEILRQLPDEQIDASNYFDIDDYFYGEPFENMGDLLCHVDDTDSMTYGDNGDGEYFFYYIPSYPWERRENEPESIEEVHNRIYLAVQKLCDISREEVEELIDDDIYEYGCG